MTTLIWTESSDDVYTAPSNRPLPDRHPQYGAPYTGAHYMIEEDSGFELSYVYEDDEGDSASGLSLGRHWPDFDAAEAAAERWEQTGDLYSGAEHVRYREANLGARFTPQTAATPPTVDIGLVEVGVSFDEGTGQLVVSVGFAGAELPNKGVRLDVDGQNLFEQKA